MKWRALSRTQAALEYPLATGLSVWSVVMGLLVLYGLTPSYTISRLDEWQATAWGVGLIIAATTTAWGLFVSRKVLTVARGMYLSTITILVYALSIIIATGWTGGGGVASFLFVIALVNAREAVILRRRATPGPRGES